MPEIRRPSVGRSAGSGDPRRTFVNSPRITYLRPDKSLLGPATLGAECDTTLEFVAHGPDAEGAVAALTDLIGAGFDGPVGRGRRSGAGDARGQRRGPGRRSPHGQRVHRRPPAPLESGRWSR